jgi:hypothetical protein
LKPAVFICSVPAGQWKHVGSYQRYNGLHSQSVRSFETVSLLYSVLAMMEGECVKPSGLWNSPSEFWQDLHFPTRCPTCQHSSCLILCRSTCVSKQRSSKWDTAGHTSPALSAIGTLKFANKLSHLLIQESIKKQCLRNPQLPATMVPNDDSMVYASYRRRW